MLLGSEGYVESPCDHLMFRWISEDPKFERVSSQIEGVLEEMEHVAEKDDEGVPAPWEPEFLKRLPDGIVVFSFSATPPSGITVVLGIKVQHGSLEPSK